MAPKQPASAQQVQQRLYRTLHDQLDLALYPQALRTVNKRKHTLGSSHGLLIG